MERNNLSFITQIDASFQEILEYTTKKILDTKAFIIDKINRKVGSNTHLKHKLMLALNDISHIYSNAFAANFQPFYVVEDLIQVVCDNIKYKSANLSNIEEMESFNSYNVNLRNIVHHAKIANDKIIEQILEGFNIPPEKTPHKPLRSSTLENKIASFSTKVSPVSKEELSFPPMKPKPASVGKENFEKGPDVLKLKNTLQTNHRQIMYGGLGSIKNGKYLVTAGTDGQIKMWNSQKGDQCKSYKAHDAEIYKIVYIEEKRTLVSASVDGVIKLWNVDDITITPRVFKAHTGCVFALEYLSDFKIMASGGEDEQLRLWDVDKLNVYQIIQTKEGKVGSVAYFKGFKKMAVGYEKGTINFFTVNKTKSERLYSLIGHTNYVLSLTPIEAISTLVSGSDDGIIRMWKLEETKGTCFRELRRDGILVRSIVVFSEKDLLMAACGDQYLRVWKISSGELIKQYDTGDAGESIVKLGKGEIATGYRGGEVRIWNFADSFAVKDIIEFK
jgi:WD40 repeat protein